jgi:prefoldin alpha subunit
VKRSRPVAKCRRMSSSGQTTSKQLVSDMWHWQSANEVELGSLSGQQLAEIKQQLEKEVEHLGDSFQKLRQAQAKFRECAETVQKTSKKENADQGILVPLTASLYVPGKLADIDTYMVDVGTGYFVEKV